MEKKGIPTGKTIKVKMVFKKIVTISKDYYISLTEQTKSKTTESRYVFLKQENIYCNIRISCHKRSHQKEYDFDFIADGTLDQLEKIEKSILSFFSLEK